MVMWQGEDAEVAVNLEGDNKESYIEVVYAVMVFENRGQQRRFLITYNSSLDRFCINSWVCWRRVLTAEAQVQADIDEDENVSKADEDCIKKMQASWLKSPLRQTTTLDQLQKLNLGPAVQVERHQVQQREAERKRKQIAKERKQEEEKR
ncbi:hypothetical protein AB1Y20_008425 [Prymnesium parvum]|uniref:Uncharacterized protein n=1 Tax=Prymnesium parvum TaxID=97485 RepID=A0AB34ITJ0_PRYPA